MKRRFIYFSCVVCRQLRDLTLDPDGCCHAWEPFVSADYGDEYSCEQRWFRGPEGQLHLVAERVWPTSS